MFFLNGKVIGVCDFPYCYKTIIVQTTNLDKAGEQIKNSKWFVDIENNICLCPQHKHNRYKKNNDTESTQKFITLG